MLHRRHVLSVLVAPAILASTRRAARSATTDVVIIGAGAAGLSAANELRKQGRTLEILEARHRIGGRAFTDLSLGTPYDAGAQYIHWAERNPWKLIADELGVGLIEDGQSAGGFQVFADGQRLSEEERRRRRGLYGRLDRTLEEASLAGGDISVAQAVASLGPDLARAASSSLLLSLGEDGERISVQDYQQLWSGDDYMVAGGYGALVARYGADLAVKTGTPVSLLRWDGAGVEVETAQGTLRARAAIVTVPVNVLKAGGIRFSPELPPRTRDALDGIGMGALTKIALRLGGARFGPGTRFGPGARFGLGDGAMLMEASQPERTMMIEMFAGNTDLAVAMCGGDYAREVCALGPAGATAHVTDLLASMLGPEVRQAVLASSVPAWWSDPYSQGAYSIARPGHLKAREILAEPIGNRIWIAGEATAGGGAMTVGGASLAGVAAARQIVARLKD